MRFFGSIFIVFLLALSSQSCKVKKLDNAAKIEEPKKVSKQDRMRLEEEVEDLPAEEVDIDYAMPADCYSEDIANANQRDCEKVPNYVCGCNGKTYINECEARKAGIVTITQGKCL
jgi:hypothetical protein